MENNTDQDRTSNCQSSGVVVRQGLENINVVDWCKENILDHVIACHEEIRRLRLGINAVASLIEESQGVCGLHLNGDIAPWEELRAGGRFEDWLIDFDKALSA